MARHAALQRNATRSSLGLELLEPRLLLSGMTYLVNSLADTVASDGVVTLREAIQASNTNLAVNEAPAGSTAEADVIAFDQAALQTEAGPGNPLVITLNGSQLEITDSVDIQGLGTDVLTVDGDGRSRVLHISGGDTRVDLTGLTIMGGAVTEANGGGLYNDNGTLTVTDATVSGNSATGEWPNGCGGGIYNGLGTLTLATSTVSDNLADSGGGIFNGDGTVTLTDTTVSGNSVGEDSWWGPDAYGGGIYNSGAVTLTNSTVSRNTASGNWVKGGGISNAGTLALTNSTVSGNWAAGLYAYGGGISNWDGTVTLTNSTVPGNRAGREWSDDASGGGIYNSDGKVTLTNSTVASNLAEGDGGGIYNDSTLTLNNTIVALNDDGWGGSDIVGAGFASNSSLVGVDPLFVRNPSDGGDGWGDDPDTAGVDESANDDYGDLRLLPTSPAIDAGDDALLPTDEFDLDGDGNVAEQLPVDLAGNRRTQGRSVDMGAFEFASTYVVDSLSDAVASDGVLTLREAIQAASTNTAVNEAYAGHDAEADIIVFDPIALQAEAGPGNPLVIMLGGSQLNITDDLHIRGLGVNVLAVDAGEQSRAFHISGGDTRVDLTGLTITGGAASDGGGIYNDSGTLRLANVVVSGNSADSSGGGIYNASGALKLANVIVSGNPAASGGGIYNRSGALTLTNSTVSGNSASDGGGGVLNWSGTLTLANTVVALNDAPSGTDIDGTFTNHSSLVGANPIFVRNASDGGDGWGDDPSTPAVDESANDDYGDLRLRPSSPAVDAGDNALLPVDEFDLDGDEDVAEPLSVDVAGGPRVADGLVDIGAYEWRQASEAPVMPDLANTSNTGIPDDDITFLDNDAGRTLDFEVSGTAPGATVHIYADGTEIGSAVAMGTVTTVTTDGAYDLADGVHTITARQVEPGLPDSPESAGLAMMVDTTGDVIPSLSASEDGLPVSSEGWVGNGNVDFVWSAASGLSPIIGYSAAWDSTPDSSVEAITSSYTPQKPGMGQHTLNVRAVDAAGNLGPVEAFTVKVGSRQYVVNSLDDGGLLDDGRFTLREALESANANSALGDARANSSFIGYADRDRIVFDAALFDAGPGSITLGGTQLEISDDLVLNGPGAHNLTITANEMSRVMYLGPDADADMEGLALKGGSTPGRGGGIHISSGSLTLTNVMVSGNSANDGGGIYNRSGGAVTLTNSTVSGNSANDGGGIYNRTGGAVTLTNSTVSGNSAGSHGGGIWNRYANDLLLNNTIVALNAATSQADIYVHSNGVFTNHSSLVGVDPLFVRNPSDGGDGWGDDPDTAGVDESANDDYGDLRLLPTSPAIDAGDDALLPTDEFDLDGDGNVAEQLPVDLAGNRRTQGRSVDMGAFEFASTYVVDSLSDAVASDGVLTLREAIQAASTNTAVNEAYAGHDAEADIIVFDPIALQAEAGPGNPLVIMLGGSQLNITDDLHIRGLGVNVLAVDAGEQSRAFHISGGDTRVDLTGLTITGGAASDGGGIYNDSGTLRLANVVVSGNSADSSGGGIYNASGALKLANVIVSGNPAASGGGIYNRSGALTLTNSTVSGNSASDGGGGVLNWSGTLTLANTVVALNDAPSGTDIDGTFTNHSSLVGANPIFVRNASDGGDGWGDDPSTPAVDESANDDYGDLRLRPSSPAVDAGDNALLPVDEFDLDGDEDLAEALPMDLARHQRIQGPRVDIGAYEYSVVGTIYVVHSLADVVAADSVVTLREAIEAANANSAVTPDVPAGSATLRDVITFDQSALSADAGVAVGQPVMIALGGSQLEITDSLDIQGLGADVLAVDANKQSRVLFVSGAETDVDLTGLTIMGGVVTNGGGGIGNSGTLTLTNVTVSGNSAGTGGGIYNDSTLTLANSTVSGNSAGEYGGGILNGGGSTLTLTNSTVSDNSAGTGGGIRSWGTLTLTNSTVSRNSALGRGAHYWQNGGGGIHNSGPLTLTNVTVLGNSATGAEANGGGIRNSGTLTLTNSTVLGNSATRYGGGIHNDWNSPTVTLNNTIVVSNRASAGGSRYDNVEGTHTNNNSFVSLRPVDPGVVHYPDDLRLLPTSPAIGAGDNALLPADEFDLDGDGDVAEPLPVDLAGGPRVLGPRVDIGAYEGAVLVTEVFGDSVEALVPGGPLALGAGARLELVIGGGGDGFVAGRYVLVEAAGGLTGEFASVTDLGGYVSAGPDADGLVYDAAAGTVNLVLDRSLNPGDANLDGATDVSDRIIWNTNNFKHGTTFITGDFDGDGVTDVSDRIIWNSHNFTLATASPAPLAPPVADLSTAAASDETDAENVRAMAAVPAVLTTATMRIASAELTYDNLAAPPLVSVQVPSIEVRTAASSLPAVQRTSTAWTSDTSAPTAGQVEPDIVIDLTDVLGEELDAAFTAS